MGAGFLTGAFTSRADFKEGDIRGHHHSKMSEENFDKETPQYHLSHTAWARLANASFEYRMSCPSSTR
jgi:hypothetical protein